MSGIPSRLSILLAILVSGALAGCRVVQHTERLATTFAPTRKLMATTVVRPPFDEETWGARTYQVLVHTNLDHPDDELGDLLYRGRVAWQSSLVPPMYVLWIDDSTIEVVVNEAFRRRFSTIRETDVHGVKVRTTVASGWTKDEVVHAVPLDLERSGGGEGT